ncbi:YfjI family protein [Proteus mirabilis]|uniref:YfjI family protein n=1 Tax=Proteus mirabilis TaxID=584 RepID=UPI0034E44D5F
MSNGNPELCLQLKFLPEFFQQLIGHIHAQTGASPDIILPTLLGVMGIGCQDNVDVQPIQGLRYPTSLYTFVLAKSGNKKTTVFRMLAEPIIQWEKAQKAEYGSAQAEYQRHEAIWKMERKAHEKHYQKMLKDEGDVAEAHRRLDKCLQQAPVKPVQRRLIINDPTSEALSRELGQGYPVLTLASDEAGALFDGNLFHKISLLNSLWCGESISVSRVSRDNDFISDARFSILLMLQPELFNHYLRKKGIKFRYSGGLSRFLLVDLNNALTRLDDLKTLPLGDQAFNAFSSILSDHLDKAALRREHGGERQCMTLTAEAQKCWYEQQNAVAKLMDPGGSLQHYDDFSARYMEHVSRIAAVMQVFMAPNSTLITEETLSAACYITQWYLNHFIAKIDETRELSDAEKLIDWLEDHLVTNGSYNFKTNYLIKYGPRAVRSSERLEPALNQLEREGKLKRFIQDGIGYVGFIGAKMTPEELAERLNIPFSSRGVFILNNSPKSG